ncbi:aminotransferase class III-fold pyridoxal phosphate-dependent enzyme [candidate division KSB1 bacterium]|nr:aminotransferase class III-fold pyridoxal phosphate-dependent enzyme [candidate division KSB1 bacterium]
MSKAWWQKNSQEIPKIVVPPPGPKSKAMHANTSRYFRGLSSQVKLFPVCFDKGYGITITDVDGNTYLDFSSGIYVASLGHGHPRIAAAIAHWAERLMNCHDFTTPVKAALVEKLATILPENLHAMQFYSDGASAVEAGLRAARAISGKHEFISCYQDFHGKSMGAVSCARMTRGDVLSYGPSRVPGFYMVPRPDPYRPLFCKSDGTIDTDAFIDFYKTFIREGTVGNVAAFVLEPAQGWAGSIFPPDDFFPKLSRLCHEEGVLLFDDEILAGMGRTGEWLCLDHWKTVPDIVTFGKSFGNGFPVTAMIVKKEYADALDKISASSSYGGNPMACAAALASLQVIEEENILENVRCVGRYFMRRMKKMQADHAIIGDVKGKGFLLGIELVKDKKSKEPFDKAGKLVYQYAFQNGLAWIPAGHILRMSPPLIMNEKYAALGMDIIEDAITNVERELGY